MWNWNLDDGYLLNSNNDNMLMKMIPFRTGGTSYYHRLKLVLHNLNDVFMDCPNRGLESSFVVYNKNIYYLYLGT